MTELRMIPLDLINITARKIDPDWVAALAENISRHGQQTPVDVEIEGDRYRLVTGFHRAAACNREIRAIVHPAGHFASAARERLATIAENFLRRNLTVLERATIVADWRAIYEAAQGEVKRGRKKLSHAETISNTDPAMQMAATFAANFSDAAQRALGLTRQSVYRLLQIAGLDPETLDRVSLTGIANSQADLLALAGLPPEKRTKVLDLLLSTPPQATAVAEAIMLAEGRKPPSPADRLFSSAQNSFGRLSDKQRASFFELYQDHVRAFAQKKGWL